jgi:hypothetical protein
MWMSPLCRNFFWQHFGVAQLPRATMVIKNTLENPKDSLEWGTLQNNIRGAQQLCQNAILGARTLINTTFAVRANSPKRHFKLSELRGRCWFLPCHAVPKSQITLCSNLFILNTFGLRCHVFVGNQSCTHNISATYETNKQSESRFLFSFLLPPSASPSLLLLSRVSLKFLLQV